MKVPFFKRDIEIESSLIRAFKSFLSSNQFVLGEKVEAFEQEFSTYLGVNHTIGVASGLDAIKIAFMSMGLEKGDEVILSANAFYACFLGITALDGIPVLVEPCQKSLNIDVSKIESVITPKTKFLFVVHLFGQSCEMDEILDIAKKYNLTIIEDFSQAHGAEYKGKKLGSFGKVNICSFYPSKNLGAYGDGGALTTNDSELKNLISCLRNYGSTQKDVFKYQGLNSRLDSIQAAFLSEKLPLLDNQNLARKNIAKRYLEVLCKFDSVLLPMISDENVFHQFVIRLNLRDELKIYLESVGIETLIHYPIPAHRQLVYRDYSFAQLNFPLTDEIANTSLSLPISPFLSTAEINYVCHHLELFFQTN
jgi:dTDP-4-amino-4,6-dideoxygalactose transaminase